MSARKTASQIGKANLAKSKRDEAAVATYLRESGLFPLAERAVRTGFRSATRASADPGDITGTPGVVWSVKSYTDPVEVERRVPEWLHELYAMQPGDMSTMPVRLLVIRRYGKSSAGDWWCVMRAGTFLDVIGVPGGRSGAGMALPVRATLAGVVAMMLNRQGRAAA